MKIIKRNGSEVDFDITKIIVAVTKANDVVPENERMTPMQIQRIAQSVELACQKVNRAMSVEEIQDLVEKQIIEVAPLAYMRGRTLDDSFIILDEAQNTTPEQMKMFLTRMGVGSKVVVTGDVTQIDLPGSTRSGLVDALKVLKDVNGIAQCYFTDKDVVRHRLVQEIVKAYERAAHPAADAENKENNKNFK